MKLALHFDAPDEGDPQSPVPLSVVEAFARVLEDELLQICPEVIRYDEAEISLTFMSSEEMREVNRDYREKNEPTDVLSFPLWEENGIFAPSSELKELLPLGDILICPEELGRLHEGLPLTEALCLVLAHGFLHLLAWDHDTYESELAMWSRQDSIKEKLLKAWAVSAPYSEGSF